MNFVRRIGKQNAIYTDDPFRSVSVHCVIHLNVLSLSLVACVCVTNANPGLPSSSWCPAKRARTKKSASEWGGGGINKSTASGQIVASDIWPLSVSSFSLFFSVIYILFWLFLFDCLSFVSLPFFSHPYKKHPLSGMRLFASSPTHWHLAVKISNVQCWTDRWRLWGFRSYCRLTVERAWREYRWVDVEETGRNDTKAAAALAFTAPLSRLRLKKPVSGLLLSEQLAAYSTISTPPKRMVLGAEAGCKITGPRRITSRFDSVRVPEWTVMMTLLSLLHDRFIYVFPLWRNDYRTLSARRLCVSLCVQCPPLSLCSNVLVSWFCVPDVPSLQSSQSYLFIGRRGEIRNLTD